MYCFVHNSDAHILLPRVSILFWLERKRPRYET